MQYQTQQQPIYGGQFQGGAGIYGPSNLGGMVYNPIPQAKMTQGLSQDDIKELRRRGSGFSLDIPAIEFKRAKCTHKENGQFATVPNNDGSHTCTICGETFVIADYDVEVAKQITDNFLALFQSIKLCYLNMPESYIENITQIIPLIKQMPELYRIAISDFNKYESGAPLSQRGGLYGANLLNTIVNPAYGGGYGNPYGQQQQYAPQPGAYPQQPQGGYYAQPVGDPNYYNPQQYAPQPGAYPQQPQGGYNSNGFGYYDGQQAPVVNQGAQVQQNQAVQGGSGQAFTKENANKASDPNTTKIYNS